MFLYSQSHLPPAQSSCNVKAPNVEKLTVKAIFQILWVYKPPKVLETRFVLQRITFLKPFSHHAKGNKVTNTQNNMAILRVM